MTIILSLTYGALFGAWFVLWRVQDRGFQPIETLTETMETVATDTATDAWVAKAKQAAIELATNGDEVSADAVWNACPPPAGVDGRAMARVFSRDEWEIAGRVMSERGRNKARMIALWRLKSREMIAA